MHLPPLPTFVTLDALAMVYGKPPVSLAIDDITIQKLVHDNLAYSRHTITKTEHLPGHLHPICRIHLSDGSQLILKLHPPSHTSLLRHERHSLETEATVLSLLARIDLPIPRPLRYDKKGIRLNSPFLLTTYLPGSSLASPPASLSHLDRRDIEVQIRNLTASIARHTAPTFGPVHLVASNRGFHTWRDAFAFMVESVLMDAEDSVIHLPYADIREAVRDWGKALDAVKVARLVVLGMGNKENVLIGKGSNDVTGLLDFGRTVWGDVDFMQGAAATGTKGLLYTTYHSLVTIVTNHYRPRRDAGELDARKTLTRALAELKGEKECTNGR